MIYLLVQETITTKPVISIEFYVMLATSGVIRTTVRPGDKIKMTINVSDESKKRMIASIQQYVSENMDEDIGDLQASLLLEFVLKEIAPSVYNSAIVDAQAHMQERVSDLDGTCYQQEFTYWSE